MCWVPPPRHTHTGKHSGRAGGVDGEPGFVQCGAAAVQPAGTLKTQVRVLFRRQAEEEYEEEMRHPADTGSSDGARCCRCAVPGASFLCIPQSYKRKETFRAGRQEGWRDRTLAGFRAAWWSGRAARRRLEDPSSSPLPRASGRGV